MRLNNHMQSHFFQIIINELLFCIGSQKHSIPSRTKREPRWQHFPPIVSLILYSFVLFEFRTINHNVLYVCVRRSRVNKLRSVVPTTLSVQQQTPIVHTRHVISVCLRWVNPSMCAHLTVPSRFPPFSHGSCPFSHGSVTIPV